MSTPVRCATLAEHHRGAVVLVECVMEIRVPGHPTDSAPVRMPMCEACVRVAQQELAKLRAAFGGAS